ncbi:hypothetical protein B1748_36045, partial [Paenibacillus sp. MY03]|uniref:hypothetical protein n=1 Tax=Paenibacillus sp. MY03 TaxID=302980 RepID=UPI000B56387A
METRHKMLTALTTAACLLAGTGLTGCSNPGADEQSALSGNESSATAADPYADLPKAVSISAFDRGAVSSDEGTYE